MVGLRLLALIAGSAILVRVIFTFDEFELDAGAFELRKDGEVLPLEPQVLDVLALLVEQRDQLVTKEQLLDQVWGDRFVSESALTSRIKDARRALGDDGRTQRYIKTVHGRGYRFHFGDVEAGEVQTIDVSGGQSRGLPSERTSLIGRDADVEELAEIVVANRLVTLFGIGGIGKTRVAVAAARTLAQQFPDGVCFVDLVPVTDLESLVGALAGACGVGSADRMELARVLHQRRTLIVMDNCEHVAADAASVIDTLLDETESAHFLCTSRGPLEVHGEQRRLLEPLSTEWPGPAVDLFSAAADRFGARLRPEDGESVARICKRLDGLPLALEFAAAQLRHLDLAQLEERLQDRLDFVVDPDRRGSGRRASLHVVLEDTWSMVTDTDRRLMRQLSAFRGSFDVVDVEEVCLHMEPADIQRSLASVIDHNMVIREPGGVPTFRLLETVRTFVRGRADEATRVEQEDRHAAWCLERVGGAVEQHLDPAIADWCGRHRGDLRSAVAHLLDQDRALDAARIDAGAALGAHGDEGPWAGELLSRLSRHLEQDLDPGLTARLHLGAVVCGMATRSPEVMALHGDAAIGEARHADEPVLLAFSLVLGSWMIAFRDPASALLMIDEAQRLGRSIDHVQVVEFADAYGAFYLAVTDGFDEARALVEPIVDSHGDDPGADFASLSALVALASLTTLDDPGRARGWSDELLGRSTGRQWWGSAVLVAAIEAASGDAAACAATLDGVRGRLDRSGWDTQPDVLVPIAVLAWQRGDHDRAAGVLAAVRDDGRPTQSFQVTTLYRQLRQRVHPVNTQPAIKVEDAFAWLAAEAGDTSLLSAELHARTVE